MSDEHALSADDVVPTCRHRYNAIDESDELLLQEIGWKYCHADVLRPPRGKLLLATAIGGGVQLLCMSSVALLAALLGLASPTARGTHRESRARTLWPRAPSLLTRRSTRRVSLQARPAVI